MASDLELAGDLRLNHKAEERKNHKAKEYNRKKIFIEIVETGSLIIFLILFMYLGWSLSMEKSIKTFWPGFTAYPWVLNGIYFLAFFLLIKAVLAPLDYYSGYATEHRYGLSSESLSLWVTDEMKELAVFLAFGLIIVEIVYGLIRTFPSFWWLMASIILNAILIILAKLAPVLLMPIFFRFERIGDLDLEARLLKLTDRIQTGINGVFEMNLSKKTRAANAALAGIGHTRRIILSDTLLENYSHDEIESIMAHELGHHVYNHMWKGIFIQSILITLLLFSIAQALPRGVSWLHLQGIHDIAGLPYLTLVTVLFSLIFLPLINLYFRYQEYQADQYVVSITGKRDNFISALEKLSQQNLCEQEPNPVIEFLFYNHPSISKRIGRLTDG